MKKSLEKSTEHRLPRKDLTKHAQKNTSCHRSRGKTYQILAKIDDIHEILVNESTKKLLGVGN